MIITNDYNVPPAFVRIAESVFHKEYRSFLSASEINYSTRMYWLRRRHWNDIKMDVSECLWLILGIGIHEVLHKYGETENNFSEEYLHTTICDKKISGVPDIWEAGVISDYKVTGAFAIQKGNHEDWTRQLNIYAYLMRDAGFSVKKIEAIAIIRDWMKAKSFGPDYPQIPIMRVELPLWPQNKTKQMLIDKVNLLLLNESLDDNSLPACTAEEKWQEPDRWAVKKRGTKKALPYGLHETESKAFAFRESRKDKENLEIEFRPGEDKRCAYCAGKEFCCNYLEQRRANARK